MSDRSTVASGTGAARSRVRVAVVAADAARRESWCATLGAATDLEMVAWADSLEPLVVLGTRADVCLSADPPPADAVAQLRDRGCRVVVPDGEPLDAVRRAVREDGGTAARRRPALAPRQRDVLVAYASSSDLLPTVARSLGMDPETLKTHLRRIRAKYAEVGRPSPTRRDLYVRAVEDGLVTAPFTLPAVPPGPGGKAG